ncbi:MAG: SH3-like domain-containing protein [Pikeienuella sp.]
MTHAIGAEVTIKRSAPPGHVRTPWYLRGKIGVIERDLGLTGDPETLAYGHAGGSVRLYRVRFSMTHIWGSETAKNNDTLDAEIFETWLEE